MIFRIFALVMIASLAACGGGGSGGTNNNNSSKAINSSINNVSSTADSSVNNVSSTADSSVINVGSSNNSSDMSVGSSTNNVSSSDNSNSSINTSSSTSAAALHQITLVAAPVSGGTITGGGEYVAGADVTVTATPKESFQFAGWKESGVVVSTDASYTFPAGSDRSLVASFVMDGQVLGWTQSFIGNVENIGSSAEEITRDASGNIYVAGATSVDLDGTYEASERHYYLAKYSEAGALLYFKQFSALAPTTTLTSIDGLATDSSGNVYVLRMASHGVVADEYPVVHKFSASGEALGQFSLTTCVVDDLYDGGSAWAVSLGDLAIDADGNLFVAGDCWFKNGYREFFLAKYDPLGQRLSFNKYTSDLHNTQALSLALDADGNVYVAGQTFGGLDGNTYIGGYVSAGDGTGGTWFSDGFIAKFDNQGTRLYTRQFGSGGSMMDPADIAVDDEGRISVVGGVRGSIGDQVRSGSYQDFMLVNYDANGDQQFTRQWGVPNGGGSVMTVAKAVDTDAEGNIYVIGNTGGGSVLNMPEIGEFDTFLVKYKPDGEMEGAKLVGVAGGYTSGSDLEVDPQGNVFAPFATTLASGTQNILVKKETGPWTLPGTNPDPGGDPEPTLDWKDNWLFVQSDKAVQYRLAKVREDSANNHYIFRIQYRVNSEDEIYTPASNGYHLYRFTDSSMQYRVEFPASFTGLSTIYELPLDIALFVDGTHVSWDSTTNKLVYHDPAYLPSSYTSCVDDNSSTSRCEDTYGWDPSEISAQYTAD